MNLTIHATNVIALFVNYNVIFQRMKYMHTCNSCECHKKKNCSAEGDIKAEKSRFSFKSETLREDSF